MLCIFLDIVLMTQTESLDRSRDIYSASRFLIVYLQLKKLEL